MFNTGDKRGDPRSRSTAKESKEDLNYLDTVTGMMGIPSATANRSDRARAAASCSGCSVRQSVDIQAREVFKLTFYIVPGA